MAGALRGPGFFVPGPGRQMEPMAVPCVVMGGAYDPPALSSINTDSEVAMAFELPPLPYPDTALEPHISAKTLQFHHGKHHASYVKALNELIKSTPYETQNLEAIIRDTAGAKDKAKIFNNAAQHWNHSFFWKCLAPKAGGRPAGELARRIDSDLGGFDKFADSFAAAAAGRFGSGWAWLVLDGGKLKVTDTGNADLPLAHDQVALLTIDVWEHAYYLDYQNRRPDFARAVIEHLLNWDFALENLKQAGNAADIAA